MLAAISAAVSPQLVPAYCWGINFSSELGTGTPSAGTNTPRRSPRHHFHAARRRWRPAHVVLTSDGAAFCWGAQPGTGTATNASVPRPWAVWNAFQLSRCRRWFTCGLTPAGGRLLLGRQLSGELGMARRRTVHAATSGRRVELCDIALGGGAMPVRHSRGRGVLLGSNSSGELGTGSTVESRSCCGRRWTGLSRDRARRRAFVRSRCPERRIVGQQSEGRSARDRDTEHVPVPSPATDVHGVVRGVDTRAA